MCFLLFLRKKSCFSDFLGRNQRPSRDAPLGVPAAGSFCLTILLRCGRGRGLPGPWLPWYCPGGFGRGKPLPYAQQHKKSGDFRAIPG